MSAGISLAYSEIKLEKGTWICGSEVPVRLSSLCALWDEAAVLEQPWCREVGGSSLNRDVQPEQPGKAKRDREIPCFHRTGGNKTSVTHPRLWEEFSKVRKRV